MKPANHGLTAAGSTLDPIAFFRLHSKTRNSVRQLDDATIAMIAATALPFSAADYYAFAELHLQKGVDEELYLDEKSTYYREIITNDDELKCLQFLAGFYTAPVLCDAGCGIGNMLHFSARMGYRAFGFEVNTALAPIHRSINAAVDYGDLLTMDLERMRTADVVYLYRPINSRKLMQTLLQRIRAHTRQDVVVIYNYPHQLTIEGFTTIILSNYDKHMLMLIKK